MNCEKIPDYSLTYFWLLTRHQDFRTNSNTSGKYEELLQTAYKKYGVVVKELIEANQTNCDIN
jgi:hypothetical protein